MFVLEKVVDRTLAVQSSVPAPLEAAFFEFVPDYHPVIDPDCGGIDFASNTKRAVYISSPDACRESVIAFSTFGAAACKSASSKIIIGVLPPSSV